MNNKDHLVGQLTRDGLDIITTFTVCQIILLFHCARGGGVEIKLHALVFPRHCNTCYELSLINWFKDYENGGYLYSIACST